MIVLKLFWQRLLLAPATIAVFLFFANSSLAQIETKSEIDRHSTRIDPPIAEKIIIQREQGIGNRQQNTDATINRSPFPVPSSTADNNSQILEQIEYYNSSDANELGQIVNVFQLTDVSPGDWAFEALRSLVERYGCIVGYPNNTFKGNRALSRWEFAAGLNACLDRMERLIAASVAVLREDIERLQRLSEEFQAELADLGVRLDDLEGRVAFLEDNQFSTTTKLVGEVISSFQIAGGGQIASGLNNTSEAGGQYIRTRDGSRVNLVQSDRLNSLDEDDEDDEDDEEDEEREAPDPIIEEVALNPTFLPGAVNTINSIARIATNNPALPDVVRGAPDDIQDNLTLGQRTRLNLNTSFTGKDTLTTRLESGNITRFNRATGTETARLGYDLDNDNDIELGKLWYRTPLLSDKLTLHLGLVDVDFDDISDPLNPFFESSGSGALSRFGRRNPAVYRNGADRAIGLNWKATERFRIDVAYLTSGAADPSDKDGFSDGDYTAAIQFNFEPTENFEIAVTYGRSYYPSPETDGDSFRSDRSIGSLLNFSGSTGSLDAKNPFAYYQILNPVQAAAGDIAVLRVRETVAASANRVGLQANWRVTDRFNVGGWLGYVNAIAEANPGTNQFLGVNAFAPQNRRAVRRTLGANFSQGDTQDIWNGAVHFALLDLGLEGSVLGLIVGIPPVATNRSIISGATDTPVFLEAQYRIPIGSRFLITPGAYAVFNPNQNSDNDTAVIGTLRTTFRF